MPRHILIKLTKIKHRERILKTVREKQKVTYKRNPIRLSVDLSADTLKTRGNGRMYLKYWKGKNLQPKWHYLERSSFKIDGEIKIFTDKQKLRKFSTTNQFYSKC